LNFSRSDYSPVNGLLGEGREACVARDDAGKKKGRLHQLLTEDIGHPALAQHLHAVITLMKASKHWNQFKLMLDTALPKRGSTLQLPYVEDE
jgi:hypothetical protein